MELVPWRSFGEFSILRNEMEKLWNRFGNEISFPEVFTQKWAPSVDISETKDNVEVKAELPGLEPKDIKVNVSEDVLTIRGEKKREEEKKDEHYHYRERYSGSFQRSFRLPATVQSNKVEAAFKNGVLMITLPKAEESQKKEIEIKVK